MNNCYLLEFDCYAFIYWTICHVFSITLQFSLKKKNFKKGNKSYQMTSTWRSKFKHLILPQKYIDSQELVVAAKYQVFWMPSNAFYNVSNSRARLPLALLPLWKPEDMCPGRWDRSEAVDSPLRFHALRNTGKSSKHEFMSMLLEVVIQSVSHNIMNWYY